MVKIEDTVQPATFVEFTPLVDNVNDNFDNFSSNTIRRKMENFTLRGSEFSWLEYDEHDVFETVEFLDRTIKNIKVWN